MKAQAFIVCVALIGVGVLGQVTRLHAQGSATPAAAPVESSVAQDLVRALTLQGIRCERATKVKRRGVNDYEVACDSGGRFRLTETDDGRLGVFDLLAGVAKLGVEGTRQVLRLPGRVVGQMLGEGKRGTPSQGAEQSQENGHIAAIARGLYAIITLAGNACDEVVDVQRRGRDDHVATCANGRKYRVFTRRDGNVAVEEG